MSKAKTLAATVSTGGVLADGTVSAAEVSGLAAVATSGAYADLSGKPSLATVATTGSFNDLSDKPGANAYLPSQTGNAGKFLTTDGTNASWGSVASSGTNTFTTSSNVTAGAAVSLKPDGTVKASGVEPATLGSAVTVNTSSNYYPLAGYDAVNDKFVYFYVSGNALYGVVGTASGTTVTLGTPVALISANVSNVQCVSYDSVQNVFLLGWVGTNGYSYATCCAVSGGTSLTVGGSVNYAARSAGYNYIVYAQGKGCHVLFTSDDSVNPSQGYVATIYTFGNGTPVVTTLNNIGINWPQGGKMAWNPVENKARCVIRWAQVGQTSYYYSFSVSGSGASSSASASGDSSIGDYQRTDVGAIYDSVSSSILQFYYNGQSSRYECVVFNSSGTKGSVALMPTGYVPMLAVPNAGVTFAGQSYLQMKDASNYVYLVPYTITGTSVSFGTPGAVLSEAIGAGTLAISSASLLSMCYYTNAAPTTTLARLFLPALPNISQFIGIAKSTVTSGNPVDVNTVGAVNTQVSGLTTGSTYYLDGTGALTTTSTSGVKVGRALAANKLLVTGGQG